MVLSSVFRNALRLSLVLTMAGLLVTANDAWAQRSDRGYSLPRPAKVKPWQKRIDRYYRRINPDPQRRLKKAERKLYGDPGKLLGLPSNPKLKGKGGPKASASAPLGLDPDVANLDSDGDGSISRSEYLQGRSRLMSLNSRVNGRQRQRLESQFRHTDLNRDGKVTPDELRYRGTGRF